ncbi:acyltransferase family protein [Gudongella oleilytica]|uniref:acyltransferase family protein n=1 Tax=Gudongella oleilytica TaxID=1582259 RepID=UPI000FF8AF6A|nr:acyltransferase family protein [Gudongella oleilytica]
MIEYATFLRALAAILITNSHYTGVYPIDILASGGLLGDVLFFALSGFVLVNIKEKFTSWYKKRILRIYPSIWIITLIYIILGFYTFDNWSVFEYFIYPTYYHFIASIAILYIPYYIVVKNDFLKNRTPVIMVGLFFTQLIIYIFFYDKTYYHIDTVREPMIRFLFLQSMLLGLYFRVNHFKYVNQKRLSNWIFLLLLMVAYLLTKITFSRVQYISNFQILNQIILFATLFFAFKCFSSIENKLTKLPSVIKSPIAFIAQITLQIYAVQYVIIPMFSDMVFPLNWVIITTLIILSAYLLYLVSNKFSEYLL